LFKDELALSNKLVEFKGVSKTYTIGEVQIRAVNGVNFTIDEGGLVVILGASGAGKTTIFNMLSYINITDSFVGKIVGKNYKIVLVLLLIVRKVIFSGT
jgi:putative ABC transport system ATP-binding protein